MNSKPNSKKPSNDNGLNLGLNKDIIKQSQSKPNKTSNLFNPFINTNAIQNNNFNLYNPFINNTNLNQNKNEQEKTKKENKTQLPFNSTNINPFLGEYNSNDEKNPFLNGTGLNSNDKSKGVIRIQVYKSHIKPYQQMKLEKIGESSELQSLHQKTVITEKKSDKTSLILNQINQANQTNNEKIQYKMLIKKIAAQLKKKIRPRTKGFFYMKVIRSEKYLNIVKKIALSLKNKLGIHPPTHGAFGSYIQKEEEMKLIIKEKNEKYKLLIKKIATQLKKRVKLPSCKIIKIYESYRALIKKIAEALKKSMKSFNPNPSASIPNDIQNVQYNNNINEQQQNLEVEVEEIKDKNEVNNTNDEKAMDIDTNECANNDINSDNNINNNNEIIQEKERINNDNIIVEEVNNEDNKMDIEMNNNIENVNSNNIISNPEPLQENEIQAELNKEESKEKNDIKTLTNEDQKINYASTSKKKQEENPICNYTFSKMEVIENNNNNNDLANSSERNPLVELNQQQKAEIPDIQMNNDELISSNIKEEIQICEEKNDNENKENRREYLTEKKKNKNKNDEYVSKSVKKKGDFYKFSLMKKEDFDEFEIIRKKENKSHSKSNIKLNMENLHELFNKMTYIENKDNLGINISLQDIETTKANFVNQFELFLSQANIEIINNFPVSTNEINIHIFEQSNFWYLVIAYLFYKINNLSFYNILYLLEQYHIWAKDKNLEIFNSIKIRIKDYISSHFSKEIIDQFLFMNRLENLDKIFQKFESPNFYPELYTKNKKSNDYKEIKVNDINFLYEKKDEPCKCDLCTSDEACIQKVCDLNKSRIEIVNNSSMNLLKKEITKEDIIKKNNSCIVFHNNEELFYQGKSEKKSNTIFSKSKTILEEGGCFELLRQTIPLPQVTVQEEKIEIIEDNVNSKNKNEDEDEDKKIINDKDTNVELDKKTCEQKNNEDNDINMDVLDDDNTQKKSFKNISKSEKKPIEEEKNEEEIIEIKSEGKEPNKNDDITAKEKNEEENNSEDETKNIKKEKKSRKGKSRKKNNTKNIKKKKDSTVKEKKEEEKEDKADEPKEEEKEEKSMKKKKKSTNRSSLKKNKSKNCVNDDEKEEKDDKAESDVIAIGRGSQSEKKMENEPNIENSKRKKSKTPNKKKSRKH